MASYLSSVLQSRRRPLPVAPVGPQPVSYLASIRRRPPDLNAMAPYTPVPRPVRTPTPRAPGLPRQIIPRNPFGPPPLPNPMAPGPIPQSSYASGWGSDPRWGASGWDWGRGGNPPQLGPDDRARGLDNYYPSPDWFMPPYPPPPWFGSRV